MFGKLLTSLGLGQSDLEEVFKASLDRISAKQEMMTEEFRTTVAMAFCVMLDELRDRDVASPETYYKLLHYLGEWRKR